MHIFATARAARSALFVLWLAAQAVAGCTQLPLPPESAAEPRAEAIYVLAGGWHTELALPVSLIGDDVAALKPDFPGARYLVFGWGARDYYVAADPGLAEALGAILPGPAVMLVMALPAAPVPSDDASLVFISQQGAERLSRWLWDELAKELDGRPRRIAAGPYPQSIFYAASGSYDITHTCNTWTAEALRIAGLPVSTAGVMFADQVTGQLAPFAKPAPALPRLSR